MKTWAFVEQCGGERTEIITPEYKNYKLDCKKSRRNNLYYSKYEFPVYSVMDIVKPFSRIIQCGFYFINTENKFPFGIHKPF